MARLDDSTLASLLLTSRLVADGPPPLKAREFWALVDAVGGDPAVLLAGHDGAPPASGAGAAVRATLAEFGPEQAGRIRGLLDRATAFAFALEDAERSGVNIVSAFDVRYPPRLRERLGDQAPPALYTVGPVGLLSQPGLAIVGAGEDAAALDVARACAVAAVDDGLTVITGGAPSGIDAAAAAAALDAGGRVLGILADPLTRRIRQPDSRRALPAARLCLATPYKPDAPYSDVADAGRAKLVHALADLTVVISAGDGDDIVSSAAEDALTQGHGRVCVWREPIDDLGTAPLDRAPSIADTATLISLVRAPGPVAPIDPTDQQA